MIDRERDSTEHAEKGAEAIRKTIDFERAGAVKPRVGLRDRWKGMERVCRVHIWIQISMVY
jgi:hypothetical protein